MTWTRRSVLRALGASATAVSPLVQACNHRAGTQTARSAGPVAALRPMAEVRAQLRQVVAELSQRFARASALARVDRMGSASADAGEHGAHQEITTALVMEVSSSAGRMEQATTDLSREGIERALAALRERASAGYQSIRPSLPLAAPRDNSVDPAVDPRRASTRQWIDRVRQLYEHARKFGGSRVVYRGAYAMVDECQTLYLGNGRDLSQRVVRARAGVVLVAQRGARQGAIPVAELAETSGLMGLEVTDVPAARLEAAADDVLALMTPAAPPAGQTDVVLGPAVAAAIAYHCVGKAMVATDWLDNASRAAAYLGKPVGSSLVTMIDDPGAKSGYGSYFFDDEGEPARPSALIVEGTLKRPITDAGSAALLGLTRTANGRRQRPLGPVAPRLSNIGFAAGTATVNDLIAGVDRGLLLDGVSSARMDPRTWRFVARAARAYEIVGGKLSGVLYGGVDIRGDVPDLLQAVRGVSSDIRTMATSEPAASSMHSPHILTRVEVIG